MISCEQGFQKPDPRKFALALDALGVEASEALMIGDTPQTDGGAVAIGIATLILPRPKDYGPRGLDIVFPLFGHDIG
jgi:putative hydrolase of the HAD superfamily